MTAAQLKMLHEQDPAEAIRQVVGDLSNVKIAPAQVLIATYIRPEKTSSGIILTDNYRQEDVYQGKVGLILKKGALAFTNTAGVDFGGFNPQVGDWVVTRSVDGTAMGINKHHCRIVDDTCVRAVIPDPDMVF